MYFHGLNEFGALNLHIAHFSLIVEQIITPKKRKNKFTDKLYTYI